MSESTVLSTAEKLSKEIQEVIVSPEVQRYLQLMEKSAELEKEIKKYVSDEKCTVEYFDPQKMSAVKVSPTIKTTYDVDVAAVELECGPEYIETKQSVNLKMMQASPACADYLEAVATEKVIATKRVIKN